MTTKTQDIYNKVQNLFPNQKVTQEQDGWTSWAFSTADTIIRVPKKNIDIYKKESDVLDFLQDKLTVEIPKTKVYEDDDFSRIVHKKIVGTNWNLDSYNKLDKKSKDLFCEDVAKFFSELHSVDWTNAKDRFSFFVERKHPGNLNDMVDALKSILSVNELKKVKKCTNILKDLTEDRVFVHRDFYGDNSVVDSKHRLTGVFDFANVGIYNRHYDFLTFYYDDHMEMLKKIIEIYSSMTSKKIDLEILKMLKVIDKAGALTYLERNPLIKQDKISSFHEIVSYLHEALK